MNKKRIRESDPDNSDGLLQIRLLINNPEAGVVIGKGGNNVKNIRAQTSCYVSVLKQQSQTAKERVLTVKGATEGIAHALLMVSQLLLEAANQKKKGGELDSQYTFQILVHKFIAGCILGKGGAIIKEIQQSTNARISLSSDVLPGSTEKVVSITGTPDVLHAAVTRVVQQLASNPLRPGSTVMPYVPGLLPSFGSAPFGSGAGIASLTAAFAAARPFGVTSRLDPNQTRTEKIVIPAMCGGMLIGKGGAVIRDIKSQTRTQISLAKPDPQTKDDQIVSITGTLQGIQAAVYMIRHRVENYQPQNPPQQQQQSQQA